MKRGEASTPTASPSGPTSAGELAGRVAEAAADVDRPLPRLGRVELERAVAVRAEAGDERLAELDEAVEEDSVPGLDRLVVVDELRCRPDRQTYVDSTPATAGRYKSRRRSDQSRSSS